MELKTRELRYEDLDRLTQFCTQNSKDLQELERYRKAYFKESGSREYPFTMFPDHIIVAELNSEIAGYLHYYKDSMEGAERVLVSIVNNPNLKLEIRTAVRSMLMSAFESS